VDEGDLEAVADRATKGRPGGGSAERPQGLGHPRRHLALDLLHRERVAVRGVLLTATRGGRGGKGGVARREPGRGLGGRVEGCRRLAAGGAVLVGAGWAL